MAGCTELAIAAIATAPAQLPGWSHSSATEASLAITARPVRDGSRRAGRRLGAGHGALRRQEEEGQEQEQDSFEF